MLVFFPEFSDLQMRYTKKVSMWPVGLVTKVGLSSPVVNNKGVVIDFFDGWMANRKFPVDMAGFAVSVQLVLKVSTDDSWSHPSSNKLMSTTCSPLTKFLFGWIEIRCVHALRSWSRRGWLLKETRYHAHRYRTESGSVHSSAYTIFNEKMSVLVD